MRRGWKIAGGWLVVALCIGVALAWEGVGCGPEPPPEGPEGAYELAALMPAEADGRFFSPKLADLVAEVEVLQQAWMDGVSEVGEADSWQAVGAWMEGSAAAVIDDGEWMIMGWVDPEGELDLRRWPGAEEALEEGFADQVWRLSRDTPWGPGWVASDGRRIAVGSDEEQASKWWGLDEGEGFEPQRDHRPDHWPASLASWRVHGELELASWVAPLMPEADSQRMERVGQALLGGMETVHVARPDEAGADDGRRIVEVWTPGAQDERELLLGLGEARGDLPDLGGLLRSGVPGVVRLSAAPEALFRAWRRTLGVEDQERVEQLLEDLDETLEVDVMGDVVANLSGQWAMVLLGLEQPFFERAGRERWMSLIRLEAPRMAAVIPFEDRERLRRVLDAMTQLSKGQLRRQAMDRTIQYAWLDDGALEWILILDDDYLVVVDSMGAFDQVRRWEQSPRPLEGEFAQRQVDDLLDRRQGVGAYLDLATIRAMVREGGDQELARWLLPVDALRVESDIEGQRERTQIAIWPRGRQDEETQ